MMKRMAVGATLLALLVVTGAVRAADPPSDTEPKPSWWKRNLGIGPNPPPPAPKEKRDPAAEAAAARATAEETLMRRQNVCDELLRIAGETNNNDLYKKATELQQMAFEVYKRQTAHLPCARLVPGGADEKLLNRPPANTATATAAADRLTATKPADAGKTSQANAFREVKP
ncbi:MAG: hypothetical protein ACJ8F7_04240 [Gemmataceae bacterium]